MKKTNIAFSGFMAAILLSSGAAHAAAQIASKQYVDNRETSILQTVSKTYETKENVTNLTEQVTQLGDTINNEDTGLAAKVEDAAAAAAEAKQTAGTAQSTATSAKSAVEALGATVGNAESGLVKDVNDLETSVGGLQTTVGQLDTEMDSKLDSKLDSATAATTYEVLSNKAAAINEGNQTSPTAYPSVGAIVQWTNKKIADLSDTGLPVNPGNIEDGTIAGSKLENGAVITDKIADDAVTSDKIAADAVGSGQIADGAVGTDDIADGAVTSDKLDGTLAGQIADISGKQDVAMGVGHENHIVTTDASGNITSAATIGQDKVTGLTTALAGKADASALEEIEQNVTNVTEQYETINETVTNLGDTINNEENGLTQQITNITKQIGNAESGLVKDVTDAKSAADAAADAAGAAQDAVDALETTVDGKANKATTLAGYGITDAYTKTETDGLLDAKADETALANYATTTALTSGLGGKEDTSNKTKIINDGNKSSETLFPTIGAITTWTDQQIQQLSTEGIPVNPDNIGSNAITTDKIANGAVTTEKLADDSVTEDKLSNDVVASIDAKLPAPDADCVADSNLCVLTVTPSGDLAWVAVTQPAE